MVKVARAVKQKWREPRFKFAIELVDQAWRRGEAKFRPLLTRINNGQAKRLIPPRIIQIEMQSAGNQRFYLGDCKRN